MKELHLPWLEFGILVPLIGSIVVRNKPNAVVAHRWCLIFSFATLVVSLLACADFLSIGSSHAQDCWHISQSVFGREIFEMDEFVAPLLPLVASIYLLTTFSTLSTKIRRFSYSLTLLSESITLATFSATQPWVVIALLALGTVPPFLELCERGRSTRIYLLHMGLFILLLFVGWIFLERESSQRVHSLVAVLPLLGAILIRNGIAPFHGWMTDLFENASFGTALLFVTPVTGAYAAVRLVLPFVPDWVLQSMGSLSLFTAVYASGLALVQTDARRFFCYLFMSHSALILVGLEMVTPIGITGALCVWISVGLSLAGFGLSLRAVEARRGHISLTQFHGLYEHTPALAACFVLTGLASVGFPGTVGFIGTEMLVDGVVQQYPYTGVAVIIAAAFNSISIVKIYFRIFTGTRHISSVFLGIGTRERLAVLALALLVLIGGLIPQPGVQSRYHAANVLLNERQVPHDEVTTPADSHTH
jgi:NADH-quinone oxidoreductase subunit M